MRKISLAVELFGLDMTGRNGVKQLGPTAWFSDEVFSGTRAYGRQLSFHGGNLARHLSCKNESTDSVKRRK
jgi:hypothetical protein